MTDASYSQPSSVAGAVPDQAVGGHQPLHPLVVHPPTPPAQLMADPWRPVGATRLGMDGAEIGDQLSLGMLGRPRPCSRLATQA
jgi:hypothetical protein